MAMLLGSSISRRFKRILALIPSIAMCGIAGILYKNASSNGSMPIGEQLIKMLAALKHRGIDSTGVTVSGQNIESDFIFRIWVEDNVNISDTFAKIDGRIKEQGAHVRYRNSVDRYLRLGLDYEGDLKVLANAILGVPGTIIHSIGKNSEVIKDVGDAFRLDKRHAISTMNGTHGIGHVRLATESQVDIVHSHPFWAYPFPDITVVHNGQLTNYHKMKRLFEQQGHRFQTHNDSELIAVYLADKLNRGFSLKEALTASLRELDGTFTYLVSTPTGMGIAKDRWSAKPLVVMEADDVVAVASEEVALRQVFPAEINRLEPQENEVLTWSA